MLIIRRRRIVHVERRKEPMTVPLLQDNLHALRLVLRVEPVKKYRIFVTARECPKEFEIVPKKSMLWRAVRQMVDHQPVDRRKIMDYAEGIKLIGEMLRRAEVRNDPIALPSVLGDV